MAAATELSALCEEDGCGETVWMVSEPGGPDIETLFDQHLHLVAGDDGDETVFLCDGCAELLVCAGFEPPELSLGALLRDEATQQELEAFIEAEQDFEAEMGLGL